MTENIFGLDRDFIISFFLPDGMIDWFEVVNMTEKTNPGTTFADKLYSHILNIYLDERDNRLEEHLGLKPNGFTEAHGRFNVRPNNIKTRYIPKK